MKDASREWGSWGGKTTPQLSKVLYLYGRSTSPALQVPSVHLQLNARPCAVTPIFISVSHMPPGQRAKAPRFRALNRCGTLVSTLFRMAKHAVLEDYTFVNSLTLEFAVEKQLRHWRDRRSDARSMMRWCRWAAQHNMRTAKGQEAGQDAGQERRRSQEQNGRFFEHRLDGRSFVSFSLRPSLSVCQFDGRSQSPQAVSSTMQTKERCSD